MTLFFCQETNKRIRRSADIVLLADESTNATGSEMLGVFISSYDENTKKFYMDFISLVEVSSTASYIVMEGVVNALKGRNIHIKKVRFSCLDGINSMSGIHNGLQQRLSNHAPHAIYINCPFHLMVPCKQKLIFVRLRNA